MGWGKKKETQGLSYQGSSHYGPILRLDPMQDFYLILYY